MMTKLPEVTTFVINQDSSVTLTCQVECDPICNINWNTGDYDDEGDIAEDFIREDELIPEDDDFFSSMKSSITVPAETVVAFNMENFTVECVSDDNDFGDFVSSSTVVVVECKRIGLIVSYITTWRIQSYSIFIGAVVIFLFSPLLVHLQIE